MAQTVIQMIRYPVDSADFSKIREQGLLYVDKTRYISKLADYGTYYFLSRPRRFGKSLFQDTLKEYFEGNRSLFSGLYIDREKPGEWPKHPVLRFDLSGNKYLDEGSIGRVLRKRLRRPIRNCRAG